MLLLLPRLFGTSGLADCQSVADLLSFFIALPMAISALRLMQRNLEAEGLRKSAEIVSP